MSQPRRSRSSLGGMIPTSSRIETNLTQDQQFDDFRKRHSKQNKEIIADNIGKKGVVKTLQDEVDRLQKELLAVKQANLTLQSELRQIRQAATNSYGETARLAVDQILAALPALQCLQLALRPGDPYIDVSGEQGLARNAIPFGSYSHMGTSIATRPAAAAPVRLDNVIEGWEDGVEDDDALMLSVSRRKEKPNRRRQSHIASTAASRSPLPSTRPIVPSLDESSSPNTSTSSLTPSPLSTDPPSTPQRPLTTSKQTRRRRESGLIVGLREASSSPLTPEPDTKVEYAERKGRKDTAEAMLARRDDTIAEGDASEWEEGDQVILSPEDVAVLQEESSVEDLIAGDGDSHEVENVGKGKAKAEHRVQKKRDSIVDLSSSRSNSASDRGEAHTESTRLEISSEVSTITEDHAGRNRRARKSVSYKEPSLTKKMRKPDGVDEYARYSMPRHSINIISHEETPRPTPTPKSLSSSSSSRASSTSSSMAGSTNLASSFSASASADSNERESDGGTPTPTLRPLVEKRSSPRKAVVAATSLSYARGTVASNKKSSDISILREVLGDGNSNASNGVTNRDRSRAKEIPIKVDSTEKSQAELEFGYSLKMADGRIGGSRTGKRRASMAV